MSINHWLKNVMNKLPFDLLKFNYYKRFNICITPFNMTKSKFKMLCYYVTKFLDDCEIELLYYSRT